MSPTKSEARRKPEKPSTSTVPDGEAVPVAKGSHVYLSTARATSSAPSTRCRR